VSANRKIWNVRYADGEIDHNLCYECVRPFEPYAAGEQIETRVETDKGEILYIPGVVQSVSSTMDEYEVLRSDGVIAVIPLSECRRFYEVSIQVNARVETLYPGESPTTWFPGTITKINKDNETFGVLYDDGDYLPKVRKDQIRLVSSQQEDEDEEYDDDDEDFENE
jgi:hypothetical protein